MSGFENPVGDNFPDVHRITGDFVHADNHESSSDLSVGARELEKVHFFEKQIALNNPPPIIDVLNLYKGTSVPDNKHKILSILINLLKTSNPNNEVFLDDLLYILGDELNGYLGGVDALFVSQLMLTLDGMIKNSNNINSNRYLKKFLDVLRENIGNLADGAIKDTALSLIRSINQLDIVSNDGPLVVRNQVDSNLRTIQSENMAINNLQGASKDVNSMSSKSGDVRVERVGFSDHIVANIDLSFNGFVQALGMLSLPKKYIAALVQIADIQPIFVISEVLAQMLVQMDRIADDTNLYKIAIVTDHVAALQEIDSVDYIRKINLEHDLTSQVFYETYKQLLDEGYHYIISLHLNPNLKKTYRCAVIAQEKIMDKKIKEFNVEVYNTNANGVGLGLMIYEINQAIKQNYSPVELNEFVNQLVKNYAHWVCPLEYDFVKNHQWVMRLADNQNKVKMRLFHFVPVIELDKRLTIVNVSHTKTLALVALVNTLDRYLNDSNRKVNRICIEYRGVYREAIKMRNQIKVKYPTIKVSLQSVGSITTRVFGPELVGICVI